MRQELEAAINLAQTLGPAELPRLLGDLEETRATALARLTAPASIEENLEVPEAAHRLGVSPAYLYAHHKNLPFTRREGRKLLFSARGLEEYIRRQRAEQ